MNPRVRNAVLACLTLAALVTAGITHAENFASPGLVCVPESGARITYLGGNALNESQVDVTYRCPIVRRAPDGANITNIQVGIDDQHGQRTVSCFARSCTLTGGACSNSNTGISGPGTGRETLSLGSVLGNSGGYAYIACDVPQAQAPGFSAVQGLSWTD
jgi:hypothetical protein